VNFDVSWAFGLAICGIVILGLMARSNRRAGWRRERTDIFTDVLIRWSVETYNRNLPQTRAADGSGVASDLVALQAMIGTGANAADGSRKAAPKTFATVAAKTTPVVEKPLKH
jgi:hypothetical protein